MYANSITKSLLKWKNITDQDAEEYLLQSFLKEEGWKGTGIKVQGKGEEDNAKQGEFQTTKFTRYMEMKNSPVEEKWMNPPEDVKTTTTRRNMNGAQEGTAPTKNGRG